MFAQAIPNLKFRFIWLALGYSLVSLVVYLSLTSTPVEMAEAFLHQDKLFHAFAYFVLMAWFAQIYHDKFQRNMVAVVFIFMGVALEYFQSFDPARMAELADMIANTLGVALGFYLSLTNGKNGLVKLEAWFK